MTLPLVTALVATLMLAWGGTASAQQSKCLAGKTKCVSKKAAGLLKCEQIAETPNKPTDQTACVAKVKAKFDGGLDPAKGCFEKLENKVPNDCITVDDTASLEGVVDSCVGAFVTAIDPPPLDQSKCGAGKKKCVSKFLAALLKCERTSQIPNKPTDPNANGCVDKAIAKYTGGLTPAKGCFAKLEAKVPNDCLIPIGNSAVLQGLTDACVDEIEAALEPVAPPGVELQGALPATPGRFNYNLTLGLPGANSACNTNFPGTHACTYAELQAAEAAGDLDGLLDINSVVVTSFWAIDNTRPPLDQCQDDAVGGSLLNWEYGTAHTPSRGDFVNLNNGAGTLGTLQSGQQCNFTAKSVGCCL